MDELMVVDQSLAPWALPAGTQGSVAWAYRGQERFMTFMPDGITESRFCELMGYTAVEQCAPSEVRPNATAVPLAMSWLLQADPRQGLEIAGQFLHSRTLGSMLSPWERGLVLHAVRRSWQDLVAAGVVERGENFWGWALEALKGTDHVLSVADRASLQKQACAWMDVVRTFILNEDEKKWIAEHTMLDFLQVPMSKCIRVSSAVHLDEMTPTLIDALFDPAVTVEDLRALLARDRQVARQEKARLEDVASSVVDEDDEEGFAEVVAAAESLEEIYETGIVPVETEAAELFPNVPENNERARWEWDEVAGVFGYWKDGVWTPAIFVRGLENDTEIQWWVDQVLANLPVRVREYDSLSR